MKQRKDGRYEIKIYIGEGKYKTIYGSTQRECKEKAFKVREALSSGLDIAAPNDSFGVWAERWLAYKEQLVGASQYRSRCSCLGHWKASDVWNVPLSDLKPMNFQSVINDLASENPNTHRPTAKRTLIDVLSVARSVAQYAVDNRVISYNPVNVVSVPKSAPVHQRRALTDEEISWIWAAEDTPVKLYALIMLYTGLRRGELMALTWKDLKPDGIHVTKAIEYIDGRASVKSPKTVSGTRIVPVPDILQNYIDTYKRLHKTRSIMICHNSSGKYYTPTGWSSAWHGFMIELDMISGKHPQKKSKFDGKHGPIVIDQFTPHCLRHTYATMLYSAGVDILTAQYLLGHSNVKTTLGIYTHLDAETKTRSIDKLNELFSSRYSSDIKKIS